MLKPLLKKLQAQAHLLSRVSSVGDEGVDEELVSVSGCNVQWCVSVFIFTVNLSTFRRKQTKHLARSGFNVIVQRG